MQKLSVLVPVYNVEKYIKRCVDSLKNQTYKNLEIIFVDDCSTDNSLNILKEEIKDMPNAKILQHDENKGLFLARLTALLDCTGDYIAFLDSDDYVDYNFYETYMKVITEEDADVCLCEYEYKDIKGTNFNYPKKIEEKIELYNTDAFKYLSSHQSVKYNIIPLWTKIIKRNLFDETKDYLLSIQNDAKNIVGGEDSLYTTILCSKCKKMVNGRGSCLYYFQHDKQSVGLENKQKMFSNLESHIRCNILARNYVLKNDLYLQYMEFDNWWMTYTTKNCFCKSIEYNCLEEYNNLLAKYNFDKILNVLTYVYDTLK